MSRKITIFKAEETLRSMLSNTVVKYSDRLAFSFVDGTSSYTYQQFQDKCDEMAAIFVEYGLPIGAHIAILSQNMPNWPVAYFSITTTSHVGVPLLTELTDKEIETILIHSDAEAIFVSSKLLPKLTATVLDRMKVVICIDDLTVISSKEVNQIGSNALPSPKTLAVIIYTSGTTGTPKGVMLSHKNLCASTYSGYRTQPLYPIDSWLSMLPLAHVYEATISMLLSVFCGGSVYYMSKPPTPQILLDSIDKVRPTIILAVPLVIDKIKKKVMGELNKQIESNPLMRFMNNHAHKLMMRIVGRKLMKMFGENLIFFGVGGAKLSTDTETFLHETHFPYAIGYGLTETAPLLCGNSPYHTTIGSTGKAVYGVQLKLIDVNPDTGEGELVAKGDNVMMGYYKNEEATKKVFTTDGWFKTNDLVAINEEGKCYIKGRINNVVIGASGENIYLEDVESVINSNEEVEESLVVLRQGRLTAMIKYRDEVLQKLERNSVEARNNLELLSNTILCRVNAQLNKFSQIQCVEVQLQPFTKTATHKIKRFLYQSK